MSNVDAPAKYRMAEIRAAQENDDNATIVVRGGSMRPLLPDGAMLRLRRWVQRNPTAALAVVAGVFLFVVAPSLFAWREYLDSRVIAG